ncbi:hypothetical protein RIVM261_073250 [Rivularia sp. IAM M-261]|nr:hypothetical protein RIVM261_073250 [Rivularia sp. IAM M-261]
MHNSSTKEQGKRKPTKGELEQLYVMALVKALLELASSTNAGNSQQQEVTAKWSSNNCELEVSGTSKALLELIEKHNTEMGLKKKTNEYYENYKKGGGENDSSQNPSNNQKRDMSFAQYQIERVRNAMYLLEEIQLLEDKRSRNKAGKLKNPRLRFFSLKLNQDKNLENNCEFVDEKLKNYCNNDGNDLGNSSDNKNLNYIKNEQDLTSVKLDLLRSLNCRNQKHVFSEQIGTHRVGFFRIQTEDNIQIRDWFLWVLEERIVGFETAERIPIKIDYLIKKDFDVFWKRFKKIIENEKELTPKNVIEALATYYQTKSVVIYITHEEILNSDLLNNLNSFYSQLIEKINSININKCNHLVVFLIDKSNQNQANTEKTEQLVLALTKIRHGEVNELLDKIRKDKLEKQIGFEVNNDAYTEVVNFGDSPHFVIDSICQFVFKSENGIDEFAGNWKH